MNMPKLRFKSDDGSDFPDLESMPLGNLVCIQRGGSPRPISKYLTTDKGINWIKIGDAPEFGHYITATKDKIIPAGKAKSREVYPGDLILSNSMSYGYPYILKIEGCIHDGWLVLRERDQPFDKVFLCEYLGSKSVQRQYERLAAGSAAKNLNIDLVSKVIIDLPSLKEQHKLANFLLAVDDVIDKQQAEIAAWEQYKKGVTQKLFSQEVRFKADDGMDFPAWNSMNFGNVFDEISNNTLARAKLSDESGQAKNIHYGDIHTKFGEILDLKNDAVPFIIPEVDCSRMMPLQDGDIVIADTAEDNTVGKAVEVHNVGSNILYAGLHTIARRPKFKFAPKYLGYYINSNAYHDQLIPYMQGTKLPAISKAHILLTHIAIPSPQEQRKIAECLDAIDDVIALSKAELEKWRELKQGLLQQLFV